MKSLRFAKNAFCMVLGLGLMALTSVTCEHSTELLDGSPFPSIPPSPKSPIPDSVAELYQVDAYRLAVRYMNATEDTRVEIPSALSNALFNCLTHIYNATDLPARDTVMDQYAIHSFPNPNLHELILFGVDTSCTWIKKFKAGEYPTGNATVDSLLRSYQLSLKSMFGVAGSQYMLLGSVPPLNIKELVKQFNGIECIGGAELNGSCCDGNDIAATVEDDAWIITFRRGWGDCPAGCISSRYWDFRVSSDGAVEYLGSWGTPILPEGPQR